MTKQSKPLTCAQRQIADTQGMTDAGMEAYILTLKDTYGESPTAELAAVYLSTRENRMYAQGIRILMRSNELPIGYVSGNRCHIIAERLVKWKRGELGIDSEKLTQELSKMFEHVAGVLVEYVKGAVGGSC